MLPSQLVHVPGQRKLGEVDQHNVLAVTLDHLDVGQGKARRVAVRDEHRARIKRCKRVFREIVRNPIIALVDSSVVDYG